MGDVPCSSFSAYTDRSVFYGGVDDTRDCAACTGGPVTGSCGDDLDAGPTGSAQRNRRTAAAYKPSVPATGGGGNGGSGDSHLRTLPTMIITTHPMSTAVTTRLSCQTVGVSR